MSNPTIGDLFAKLADANASDLLKDDAPSKARAFTRSGNTARVEINSTQSVPIERLALDKAVVFDASSGKPERYTATSAVQVLTASKGGSVQIKRDVQAYRGGNSIPVTVRFTVDNATKGGKFIVACFGSVSIKNALRGLSGAGRGSSRSESLDATLDW